MCFHVFCAGYPSWGRHYGAVPAVVLPCDANRIVVVALARQRWDQNHYKCKHQRILPAICSSMDARPKRWGLAERLEVEALGLSTFWDFCHHWRLQGCSWKWARSWHRCSGRDHWKGRFPFWQSPCYSCLSACGHIWGRVPRILQSLSWRLAERRSR